MTKHHLAIAMEYAPGGDLSEYVDACKRAGVSRHSLLCWHVSVCIETLAAGHASLWILS
jgi:hypothetical protein